MGNKELRLNYQEAIQLIRVGRYEEALTLLKEIDRERPNVKNVLYPMAFCCEKLGYSEEGMDICDHLITEHDHAKAREIKARIELSTAIPEAEEVGAGAEADPLDFAPEEVPPTEENPAEDVNVEAEEPAEKTHHRRPIWLVLMIAAIAAAIVAAFLHFFVLKSF